MDLHDDNQETLGGQPAASQILGERYEILDEAGRGGMGIVYKARDRETGELVALKVVKPEIAADQNAMERFKNELRLARKITHKNVCRIHELLRFGDTTVISMEYVEGENLRQILKRFGTLPVSRVVQQICAGLREAHAQGVVHRDLKPENIVVDRAGNVKIMDFGIARSADGGLTQAGAMVGTPAYMSPEQAEGKAADQRSDIYSLGLILYELHTGAQAFRGDTPFAVALKQINETPPAPREIAPTLPVHIENVILKCLEKSPARRFQSVEELESALGDQSLPAAPPDAEPSPAPHLSVWRRSDSILLVLGILGLLFFLAARDGIFPGANFVLEVDAVSARRELQERLQRLGRSMPGGVQVELEYQAGHHILTLFWMGAGNRSPGPPQLPFPLFWRINFEPKRFEPGEVSMIRWAATSSTVVPERYALLDHRGRLKELVYTELAGTVPANYRPAAAEERREKARKLVEEACGAVPPRALLVETSGGEWGAFYNATWKKWREAGAPVWAEVSLLQEKVTRLACEPIPEEERRLVQGMFHGLFRLLLFWPLVRVLFLFATGQCHRSPYLWRRLPWALLLGVSAGWVLVPGLVGASPSLFSRVGGGLAAFSLLLPGMVAVEHHLRRRAPAGIASYVLALRGRFLEPAVALAVVRGAMAGSILLALETALAYFGAPRSLVLRAFLDPKPVGYALTSFSPALFAVSSAALHGLLLGMILLGLGHVDSWASLRKAERKTQHVLVAVPSYVLLALVGLPLHVGVFEGLGLGYILYSMVWTCALCLVLWRYDVLTAVVAVATATLWALNYPLLQILRDVGNQWHWVVVAGWVLLVALAALAAFRAQLRRFLQARASA